MTTPPFPATPEPNRPAHETTTGYAPQEMSEARPTLRNASLDSFLAVIDANPRDDFTGELLREASRRLRASEELRASPNERPATREEELLAKVKSIFMRQYRTDNGIPAEDYDRIAKEVLAWEPAAAPQPATASPDAREGLLGIARWHRAWGRGSSDRNITEKHEEMANLIESATPAQGSTLMPAATEGTVEEFKSNFIRELKSALALAETHIDALQKQIAATPATERHVSAIPNTSQPDQSTRVSPLEGVTGACAGDQSVSRHTGRAGTNLTERHVSAEESGPFSIIAQCHTLLDRQPTMTPRSISNRSLLERLEELISRLQPPGAQPNEGGGK